MAEPDGSPDRYRFGPLERRGLVAGWRGGQIAAVAAGLVVAVGSLRVSSSAPGVAAAAVAVAAGVAVATWPVAGRTLEQWAPDAVRHAAAELGRRRRGPHRRPDPDRRPGGRPSGPFGDLQLLEVDLDAAGTGRGAGPTAGVLCDRRHRTYVAVVPAASSGFVLGGAQDKRRRVGQWANVLASVARDGTAVHRVQWIERSLPPHRGTAVAPPDRGSSPSDAAGASAARSSYDALLAAEGRGRWRHEVLLAVTVHAGRASRAVKAAGGGDAGACTVLLREVAAVRRRLAEASVDAGPVFGPAPLASALRRSFEPGAARPPDGVAPGSAPAVPVRPGAAPSARWPWPMGAVAEWGSLRADGAWLATYWVAEWPRLDVGPDFLGPLLLPTGVWRTVSVVMEPLGPVAASRRIEQARTADIADAELRRRGGFLATARRRREGELLARRELELADGHAQYRFSGYVTVAADSADGLDAACDRVEQAAGGAGLELRRCYGDQLAAFLCTLPLGRGLG